MAMTSVVHWKRPRKTQASCLIQALMLFLHHSSSTFAVIILIYI